MATSMEVDSPASSVMAAPGTTGSVSIALHPLVIMNVSEHWTRVRAQNDGRPTQVFGALIGKQTGRIIEVMNSFELVWDRVEENILINIEYYNTKEEQFKQVFSDMDFIGWYTTGGNADEYDVKVHRQICPLNESPIFLKMNPVGRHTDLPINIYESVIDLVNGQATMLFVELTYTLATEEAERIGVDHVARMSAIDASESSTAEHLNAQHSSIKMLHTRVKIILEYVKAVQAGTIPPNHDIMREIYSMVYRLPVMNTTRFKEDFFNQCNDVCLMSYLGAMTKGCNTMNQFVNKFNVLFDRQSIGRRMRSIFY